MFWDFLFYGIIAVGAILFVSLTIYRIDWARHPEKYKDIAGDEDPQKAEYRKKKEADKVKIYCLSESQLFNFKLVFFYFFIC